MLDAARQGEWDQLAALEKRCQGYVGRLMQAKPMTLSENEQRTKVSIIRTILQNDAKIRAFTEPHLHELQQRLNMAHLAQRSIRAYGAQP
jgi:flagellar protein FliT